MRIDSPISCNAQITGSFTGSFGGDGSNLTGVTAEWDGSHNGNASITGSLTVSSDIIVDGTVDGVDVALLSTNYSLTSASAAANAVSITTLSGSSATALRAEYKAGDAALSSSAHTQRVALDGAQTTALNSLSSSAATALRSEYKAGDTALSSSAHAQRIALISAGDSALSASAHTQRVALDSAQTTANNTLSSSIAASLRAEYIAADSALSSSQKTYIDQKVAGVVDAAPGTLDTLNELAAALGDDPNFATTVSNSIGTKLAKASNLSDLTDAAAARTNLGVDTKANTWTGVSGDVSISSLGVATVADDSHNHIISNIDGLQSALDSKQAAGTYNTIIGTDTDIDTSGATIIDNLYMTDGVITSHGTRTLTLADLGYTGATNANYITNNNQLTNGAGYITSYVNTTYSAGNGISLSGTTFTVGAGNGLSQTASGLAMSGTYTGTFTATADIVAYSDASLKKDVSTIEGALEKTKQLRGVEFTRIEDEARSIGVIAQELEKVLPELVVTNDEGLKAVNYGQITGLLIEAIKELSAKVDELSK